MKTEDRQHPNQKIADDDSLSNIQFAIFSSYMKHVSEKLYIQEVQVIEKSNQLMNHLAMINPQTQKQFTQICNTEASVAGSFKLANSRSLRCIEVVSSPRDNQRKLAFKRKSKCLIHRKKKNDISEALQQIKEVCCDRTVGIVQSLVQQYDNLLQWRRNHQKEIIPKKKKERCQECFNKDIILQEQSSKLQTQNLNLTFKLSDLHQKLTFSQSKIKALQLQIQTSNSAQTQTFQNHKNIIQLSKQYLLQKQKSLKNYLTQIKTIQYNIIFNLDNIIADNGCLKCVRFSAIKKQILEFKRCLEKQSQILDRMYEKYRKVVR